MVPVHTHRLIHRCEQFEDGFNQGLNPVPNGVMESILVSNTMRVRPDAVLPSRDRFKVTQHQIVAAQIQLA